jgi:hypothetical protein
MNERIEEFRKQVKLDIDPHSQADEVQDLVVYLTKDNGNKVLNAYLEKFAELIVKECCDIAYEYDAPKLSGPGMIIAGRIEEHFGIEE